MLLHVGGLLECLLICMYLCFSHAETLNLTKSQRGLYKTEGSRQGCVSGHGYRPTGCQKITLVQHLYLDHQGQYPTHLQVSQLSYIPLFHDLFVLLFSSVIGMKIMVFNRYRKVSFQH